jgi:hypothetical protein
MKPSLLLSLTLGFALQVIALPQDLAPTTTLSSSSTITATPVPTSTISQTPEMSSASVSSVFAALASATPQQQGGDVAPGDAANGGGDLGDQNAAGASGSDHESFNLSKGGMIAIIVVVVVVAVFGSMCPVSHDTRDGYSHANIMTVASSVLFYLAKKRSWEVRATIRKSAKRVATALTPRRSEFPKGVRDPKRASSRGMSRMDDVPPTPRLKREDIEKGVKMAEFEMSEPPKNKKWGRKTDR